MSNIRLSKDRVLFLARSTIERIAAKRLEHKQNAIDNAKNRREQLRRFIPFLKSLDDETAWSSLESLDEHRIKFKFYAWGDLEKAEKLKVLAENTEDGFVWVSAEDMAAIIKYAPEPAEEVIDGEGQ